MSLRRFLRAACIVAGPLLAACSPAPGSTPGERAGEPPGQYVLRPGDRVEVRPVLDAPYATVEVLAPDGTITVPGAGHVQAAGKTLPELAQTLSALYRSTDVLNEPLFTVNLLDIADKQVLVGGEVVRPGPIAFGGAARSVMQAIMARGGPLSTARLDDVVILRVMPGGDVQLLSVDLTRVLSGEDLSQNATLRPMDVVIVPQTRIVQFDVAVDQYIRRAAPIPLSFALRYSNTPLGSILQH